MSLYKTGNSAEISTFCHFRTGHHFLTVSSKVHEFSTEVFSPRSARFVIFAKECFQPDISTFYYSRQLVHYFLVIFRKVYLFAENSDFIARSARFVIFERRHHLSTVCSKVHEFVQNTSLQPEISRFWHFPREHTHFCYFRKGYKNFKRF